MRTFVTSLVALSLSCVGLEARNLQPWHTYVCTSPEGAADDSDGDGVCDVDDVCADFDDWLDADGDDKPDGCDACPLDLLDDQDEDGVCDSDDACPEVFDPLNDIDGDGLCGTDDPCPETAAATCPHEILFKLQGTACPDGDVYEIRDSIGILINEGTITEPGDPIEVRYDVDIGGEVCVTVRDSYGNGGITGLIYDVNLDHAMTLWFATDYTDEAEYCASIEESVDEPRDEPSILFTEVGEAPPTCPAQVYIRTVAWGTEVGWQLQDACGDTVGGAATGSYNNQSDYYIDVEIQAGSATFVMLDSYGDGWGNGFFEVTDPATGDVWATGSLNNGSEGTVEFQVPGC